MPNEVGPGASRRLLVFRIPPKSGHQTFVGSDRLFAEARRLDAPVSKSAEALYCPPPFYADGINLPTYCERTMVYTLGQGLDLLHGQRGIADRRAICSGDL